MKSITLVSLPSPFLIDDKVFPPLGLSYLSSSLKNYNINTEILDLAGNNIFNAMNMANCKTDIIGISMTSPQVEYAVQIAKWFKENRKEVIIIAGGCGISSLIEREKGYFDYIIKGEGEHKLPNLLSNLSGYGDIFLGQNPDINSITYPDRTIFQDYNYEIDGHKTTTMLTSRGCPFSCSFCVDGAIKKVRVRNIDNVFGEIDDIYNKGYRGIMFFDDIFTSSIRRVEAIGNYLIKKSMVYRCFTHVKYAKKIAKILANTNCKEVGIGIESGDDRILKIIKKGNTADESLEAVKALMNEGVRVKAFLMVGLPGETKESMENTRQWVIDSKVDDFDISIYAPLPDTDIFNNKEKFEIGWGDNNSGIKHYKGAEGKYASSVYTPELTNKEILKARNRMYKELKIENRN